MSKNVSTKQLSTEEGVRIEREAQARLAADERASRRLAAYTLKRAARDFWFHPSPWLISVTLVAAWTLRGLHGQWGWGDALVPLLLVASFPVVEWLIHVFILHARPRHVGPVTVDSLLARKHREHHANPRDIPLVFIPWPVFLWLIPLLAAVSLIGFPAIGLSLGTGLTYLGAFTTLGLVYEWTHFLIHSDYKPKTVAYKAIWRNHRLHHYKNEHYWFSVTTSGTSDRLFGTYPDQSTVPTSPTAKNLHGAA